MNNEQIIKLNQTSDKILFDVMNNINQIFQIYPNKFQEIIENLQLKFDIEELGGGTKYGLGYVALGNEEYPTNDFLVLWSDEVHKEYYIYIYRETEDVYTSESILSNVNNALWNSFDTLMEYRQPINIDAHCSTCKCDGDN